MSSFTVLIFMPSTVGEGPSMLYRSLSIDRGGYRGEGARHPPEQKEEHNYFPFFGESSV